MSRWKVLAATPFLLVPVAFAGISISDGIEHQDSRPAVVLPAAALGPQVTLRPVDPGRPDPRRPSLPQPPGQERDCVRHDHDDDDDRDDDRDEVQVVQPCPDYVGDDDGDADEQGDEQDDDRDDSDGGDDDGDGDDDRGDD